MKTNWQTKKLGDVAKLQGGFAFKSSEYSESGTPILRMGNITRDFQINWNKKTQPFLESKREKEFEKYLLLGGELVICLTDMSDTGNFLGVVAFNNKKAFLNQRVSKFVFDNSLDKDFLYYSLRDPRFRTFATSDNTGSMQRNTSHEHILKYEIFIPPLAEQKKIVGKIEKLMAKIDEAKKLRAQALADTKNLLPSALHKIFEEGKKKGWEEKTIDDSTSKVQYGYTTSAKQSGEVKFLRITDIQNGGVNWDTVPFCDCNEVDKYKLNDKDIVFARTGATVGKSYLINNPPQNSIFASYLIRVAVDDNVSAEYVYYFFQSPLYWDQITEQKVGGAQPNVNGTKLKNLKIPLPPLAEQKKIVKYLDSLSAKVRQIQTLQTQTASDLTTLQQSILHKAFNGEL